MWRKPILSAIWGCLGLFVIFADAEQFLPKNSATQFLRRRRANSLFEESKQGNLERECIEELCNREEAREIFENVPETEYFYPRYVGCLGLHRTITSDSYSTQSSISDALRTCITVIADQCSPLPCNREGYEKCIDGKGSFVCVCKDGWQGNTCDTDIDECEIPESGGACSQRCYNYPGSFRCLCDDGFYLSADKMNCQDLNECGMYPTICGQAVCVNTAGGYDCTCLHGFKYNLTLKTCDDIDECAENVCEGTCVNTPGSYSCYCNGSKGLRLANDLKSCEAIPICVPLKSMKSYEMLYLGEQFVGLPVVYLRFRLPETSKFSAEFDIRTYDPEGIILYAESPRNISWFMLGLRDGKIEIQYKNGHSTKITSGGKAINDGQWHMITVEEMETSISVKVAKEAIMNINCPESLFTPQQGILETKVYIAGLPRKGDHLITPINPRMDGCIRAWNLMNQGPSGVKEVIKEKESKHCFVEVERGSYFPGSGIAQFQINYNNSDDAKNQSLSLNLNIRTSTTTGVLFALVQEDTVPLSVAIVDPRSANEQEIVVFIENVKVASLQSKRLCYPGNLSMQLITWSDKILITANSIWNVTYIDILEMEKQMSVLDKAIKGLVDTYVGGIPAHVPLSATPVSAYYHGCIDVEVNGKLLDFDDAISKHNDIKSHSCPPVI
ncbi:vitamin K-dependent protein S isoform X2 [Polypterus senegalus]|uniref:vitamin K-dependent protein S isoform X2 n=1 Tax=Polypterus senegalus TaxID=55291 RepID=UPI001964C3BB|nr:vitamin K-dependent protein S isoform X2 [Polypterus senegalus]